jgi:hypothetical protein
MSKNIFSGTMPALMTPCKADWTPDFEGLTKKGKEMIEAGMSAVVYCGSMGDWPLLTDQQRMEGLNDWSLLIFPSWWEPARLIRNPQRLTRHMRKRLARLA